VDPTPRRWHLHAALGLPPLLFFAPILFFGQALYHRDVGQYFYPHKAMIARALQAGHLAQWNPFEFGGMPLLVDPNFNAFHPLALLTDLAPMPWGFSLFVALNAWMTAWGTWWLARELGLPRGAGIIAALTYAWSGPYVSFVESGQSIALSTLPWQLAAFVAVARRPGARSVAIAALASAIMLLSGTPEVGACGFVLGPLLALAVLPGRTGSVRILLLSGVSVVLGVALAAVQIVPTLAYMKASSARGGGFSFGEATAYSLHPLRLLNLAFPFAFGELNASGGPYWSLNPGLNDPYVQELYVGLIPLLLACLGLVVCSRPLRVLALAGVALVLVAFGSYSPLYQALWDVLHPLHSIRFPQKFIIPMTLALALLAGAGWTRWQDAFATRSRAQGLAVLTGLFAVAGWTLTLLVSRGGVHILDSARDLTLSESLLPSVATELSLLTVALLSVALFLAGRISRPLLVMIGGALVVLDLALPALRMNLVIPADQLRPPSAVVQLLRQDAGAPEGEWRVDTEHFASPANVDAFGDPSWPRTRKLFSMRQTALFGSSAILDGVSLAKGYSGFTTARMKAVYASHQPKAMMDLFGIRYGVVYGTDPGSPFGALGFTPLTQLSGGLVQIWKNDHAGSKAWLTDAVLREQRAGVIPECPGRRAAWVGSRGGTALLPGLVVADRCEQLPPGRVAEGHAEIMTYAPEEVEIRTTAPGPALLFLNDVWDPGWSVQIDGQPAPSVLADGAFRSVAVPAGEHEVHWQYQTPGLGAGAWITAVAGLLTLLLYLFRRRSVAAMP
jgi:hypothetical protein